MATRVTKEMMQERMNSAIAFLKENPSTTRSHLVKKFLVSHGALKEAEDAKIIKFEKYDAKKSPFRKFTLEKKGK